MIFSSLFMLKLHRNIPDSMFIKWWAIVVFERNLFLFIKKIYVPNTKDGHDEMLKLSSLYEIFTFNMIRTCL